MKNYQIRIFLDYGVDRRLLVAITQKPQGDFYIAPGNSGNQGVHFSYHRSGRHKGSQEFGKTPMTMGQPIDQIKGWEHLFTATGMLAAPAQWKAYAEKAKHSGAVRVDVNQFGPHLHLDVWVIEPRDPPCLPPRPDVLTSPNSSVLIRDCSPWLFVYWRKLPG
jgi:hypothetical protein